MLFVVVVCGAGDEDDDDDVVAQVHLQTQQEVKMRMVGMAMHVVKSDGVLALYNGLSASLCRQVRSRSLLYPAGGILGKLNTDRHEI